MLLVESESRGGGGVVSVSEILSDFAKDVAGRIVLGRRSADTGDDDDDGWRGKVDALLATFHVGDYVPWMSWVSAVDGTNARVNKAFRRIDTILNDILDDAGKEEWNRRLHACVAVAAEGIGRDRVAP